MTKFSNEEQNFKLQCIFFLLFDTEKSGENEKTELVVALKILLMHTQIKKFMNVINDWAAFDASNINSKNVFSMTKLKYLICANEGDQPDYNLEKLQVINGQCIFMHFLNSFNLLFIILKNHNINPTLEEKGKFILISDVQYRFYQYDNEHNQLIIYKRYQRGTQKFNERYKNPSPGIIIITKLRNSIQGCKFKDMKDELTQQNCYIITRRKLRQKNQVQLTICVIFNWLNQFSLNEYKSFIEQQYHQISSQFFYFINILNQFAMNSIKKIQKKKRLLKPTKIRKQSAIQLEQESIISVKLTHKEQIHIKGKFQFVVVNGYLEMDLYEVRKPQIYEFNSSEFVTVIAHNVPQKIEDFLTKLQSSQLQSEVYLEFMNYILKNQPKELTLLIYGNYEISDFGYILTDQKQDLFDCQDRSVMFIGEKQVGKSTSLQLYANKWMNSNQVFILDTDLGQAIILPGFVTLMKLEQPLFLAKPQILFQGFVGEFQVFNYFDLYFNKVAQALDVYNQSQLLKDYPLLINTAGFITSYGITILQELINILQPQKCILLSRDNHKKIKEKSNYLFEQLSKKSFISNFDTFKSQFQIIHEEIDFEVYGQTIQEQTPQIRKNNRTQKIAQNIGLQNLNYLTLCSQTDIKIVDTNQCQFIVINEKKNYYDLEEIASVFIFSLVAIEQDGTFLGLGFIKDIDIINNKVHVISQIEFNNAQYYFIKSKFYNISQDQLGEINVEDVYQLLDKDCIENGEPLEYLIDLPYITLKSEAIGDFKHKITVNKKTF